MTISFSGLASGLDTSGWVDALVSIKQQKVTSLQTDLTAIKTTKTTLTDTRSAFNTFRTSLEKITDAKFSGTFDLFAKNSAKSSNESVFTATAGADAVRQSYDIAVQQLATYTKAVSRETASAVADDDTLLSNLGVTAGDLTVYVDGIKTSINIAEDTTLGDLKSQLNDAGINAELDDKGVLQLSAISDGKSINIGATTDTTNLVSLIGLSKQASGEYVSTNSLFKANISSKLTDANSGFAGQITAGTFSIGNATFNIDNTTTLSSLITQINNSEDAQASAYWDDTAGKLVLTSKKEGASYINIEAGTSNFTDIMGLTVTEQDENGNTSSKMYTDSQELGKNAIFTINGTSIISTSNTVSSDVSRIAGVTLTLNKVSSEEDGTSRLDVGQDSTALVDAVKGFVEAYNSMMSKVDEVTATGADLHGETSLTSLTRTIRNYATNSNTTNGGAYKLLSQIGISTSKADGSSLSSDTTSLTFDEEVFKKALSEDPSSVKAILAGENGVFNMMEDTVEMSLKASVGFFDVKQSTLDSDITKIEQKITKQNASVETYRAQLEKKFSNMELIISQMQQNYSSFLS